MAVRLADLLAGLSRVADLGFGLQAGTSVRSCALATRLAESLDLPAAEVRAACYTALLQHIGCVGYARETARLFGDELLTNTAAARTDAGSPADLFGTFLPTLTRDKPVAERARLTVAVLIKGRRWSTEFTATACEVGRDVARRLQLPEDVQLSLFHAYDMWRGHNSPGALNGDDIPLGARIARLAGIAAIFDSIGGGDLAVEAVRHRAGGMLDPALVAQFADHAGEWLTELAADDPRNVMLATEPLPQVEVPDLRLVAEVFGDLADLKSPYFLGHSRGVAGLAAGAAEHLHLAERTRSDLAVAGLLHDVGRVAISNAVWDRPGKLTADQWEQVRLHPYHSERILAGSTELARLAPLVGRHHERLDGSGYYRGSVGADLSVPARILAVADTYQGLTSRRPHRSAFSLGQAERCLLDETRRGTLDADAVRAVLAAAGRPTVPTRPQLPKGLSDREVEVLGLLARGYGNAQIAARLVISRRTAEHHVQHIYTKIGVSSRAAATLFAVEQHLLDGDR